MTDPKLQTTADLAQQLRDVIPPAPHFLAMLEELERRATQADAFPSHDGRTVWVALQCPNSSTEIQTMDCLSQVMEHFGQNQLARRRRIARWFADAMANLACTEPE